MDLRKLKATNSNLSGRGLTFQVRLLTSQSRRTRGTIPIGRQIMQGTEGTPTRIRVHDVVGEYAIASDDGQMLFSKIQSALSAGSNVLLDFKDVRVFATPF